MSTIPPPSSVEGGYFRNLNQSEISCVLAAFTREIASTTTISHSPLWQVTHSSLLTLRPGKWLDGEVLYSYLCILVQREEILRIHRPNAVFPPSFFQILLDHQADPEHGKFEYDHVKDWGRTHAPRGNIFHLDKLFIPACVQREWVGVLVDFTNHTVQYLDPNGNPRAGNHRSALIAFTIKYLQLEYVSLKKEDDPLLVWTEVIANQPNRNDTFGDCGVYVCAFADLLLRQPPIPPSTFKAEDSDHYRFHIALSILQRSAPLP